MLNFKYLLPTLSNLPIFYTVLISLFLLLSVSVYASIRRHSDKSVDGHINSTLIWPRCFVLVPLWLLCLVWIAYVSFILGYLSLLGGSIQSLLLAVGVPFGFILVTWFLYRWIRGHPVADAAMIVTILVFTAGVFVKQTIWLCEPLARSGIGLAQVCSAGLYEHGQGGVHQNRATARRWYQFAATKGWAAAEYWIGMHSHPIEQKRKWLQRAAEQNHADAAYQLYLLAPAETDALRWLRLSASERHPDAQFALGSLYRGGHRVTRDLKQARELWLDAARQGSLSAMRALAIAYAQGDVLFAHDPGASQHWEQQALTTEKSLGKPTSNAIALATSWRAQLKNIRVRRAAADAGDTTALLDIASELKHQANDDPMVMKKAMDHIELAAQGGSINAQYEIARSIFDHATVSDRKREQARQWLINAADAGHRQALRKVIRSLKEGNEGFEIDLYRSKAYSEELFALLEEKNVRPNQAVWMAAGWEYDDTLKRIRKHEKRYLPVEELIQTAHAGDAKAQYFLSRELMQTDFDKALQWLKTAAHGGYPQAQYEMSRRITSRKRTNAEEQQAMQWLRAAAENGHRAAMVSLGTQYQVGFAHQHIERNLYRAKRWFQRAIDGADKIVYEQKREGGIGWRITVEQVKKNLAALPDYIMRLNIEGLSGNQRRAAIDGWYESEWQRLSETADTVSGNEATAIIHAMTDLGQQRRLLLDLNNG